MEASPKVGLKALLTPDNCVLVLIDQQPFQLANVNSAGAAGSVLAWEMQLLRAKEVAR